MIPPPSVTIGPLSDDITARAVGVERHALALPVNNNKCTAGEG